MEIQKKQTQKTHTNREQPMGLREKNRKGPLQKIQQNIPKYNKIQQNTTKYNKIHQNTTKYNKIQQNTQKYNNIQQNTTKYQQRKARIRNWYEIYTKLIRN